jgi:branched-chain amino acid transport system permease protein
MATAVASARATRTAPSRALWIAIAIIVGIAVIPGLLSGGWTASGLEGTLTNIGFYVSISIIFAILALGFNLQWGYTGLFNAGIAGFYLIGAYVAAFAITPPSPPIVIGGVPVYPGHLGGFSLPFVAGALLAMLLSGLTAAVIALPALRLRADYLAIATLAFAEILQVFATNLQSLTGGSIGIILIPKPIVFNPPSQFWNTMSIIGIGAGILAGLLLLVQFITESPWGRVLRAVREDEEATMALGKNTSRYKLQSFAIGGAVMGLAGALFAVTLGYVEPSTNFAPAVTFSVWVMVIVGGAGNNRGVIIGAFLIYGMEWFSVQVKDYAPVFLQDSIFYIRLMLVGLLLIVLIIYRPEGILREAKRVLR